MSDAPAAQRRAAMRPARWEDLHGIWQVCAAHHEGFIGISFEEFRDLFEHRWLNNPARADFHAFGWVLADDSTIHGFLGLVPIRFQVAGADVVGASGTTWVMDPAYRARSLELYMPYMAWGDGHLMIDTTAGEVAGKCHAGLRRGMRHIPVPEFGEHLIWVWRTGAVVDQVAAKLARRPALARFARTVVARPLLHAAAFLRFLPHRRIPRYSGPARVDVASRAPGDLDQLWERHRGDYHVTAKRTAEFVQWRVFGSPYLAQRTTLLVAREGDRTVGYLTLYRKSEDHFTVADIFPMQADRAVRHALLRRAWELARAQGGAYLAMYSFHPRLLAELRAYRPFVFRAALWTYWYKTPPGALAEQCAVTDAWWPSGVDGDINMG